MKATVTDVNKRISIKPNKQAGTLNYDVDDKYPQRVDDITNSSGTATLCTAIFAKFIYGGGFVNETLAKTKVNAKGLTANKLLVKEGKEASKFGGVAIHVNYNALFEKTSFDKIQFENVRTTLSKKENKKHPNMLAVYFDWGKEFSTNIDEKKVDYIDFYDPRPEVIQAQVDKAGGWGNYKGQIFYLTDRGHQYTLAPGDAVLEDMQTDSHAKIFKFRNITTNFMASYIARTGVFESVEKKDAFLEQLTLFQGAENSSKFLHVEEEGEEKSLVLDKVDIQNIEGLFEFTEESVRNNIIRQYLIPPVLLLAIAGKLGSSSEIKDATAFYNGITEDERLAMSEIFRELFDNSIFDVGDAFDIKPVVANTVPVKETTEGKKAIVEILSNSALSETQKKTVLEVVYELTHEEALKLVPTTAATEEGGEEAVDEEAKARAGLKGSVGGVQGILAIQAAVAANTTSADAGAAILELIYGIDPAEAQRMLAKEPSNLNVTS